MNLNKSCSWIARLVFLAIIATSPNFSVASEEWKYFCFDGAIHGFAAGDTEGIACSKQEAINAAERARKINQRCNVILNTLPSGKCDKPAPTNTSKRKKEQPKKKNQQTTANKSPSSTKKIKLKLNRWKYLSGGKGTWVKILKSKMPHSYIELGDFDGDGITDFITVMNGKKSVSYSGKGKWEYLNDITFRLNYAKFGDFDGDGKTDVFTKTSDNHIKYLSGGKGQWIKLNETQATLKNMRFGDFDGDGKTDVFTKTSDNHIKYLSGGKGQWIKLRNL